MKEKKSSPGGGQSPQIWYFGVWESRESRWPELAEMHIAARKFPFPDVYLTPHELVKLGALHIIQVVE